MHAAPPALDARTADLIVELSPDGTFFDRWDPKRSLGPASFGNPPDCNDPAHCMTDAFRRAVIPAANLHANARGLDRLYTVLAAGGAVEELELAPASLVEEFGRCQVRGDDKVMELPTAFALGFEHTLPEWPFGPGARTYGHNGSGGSLGLVDPGCRDLLRLRDEPFVVGTRPDRPPLAADLRHRCTPRSDGVIRRGRSGRGS